MKRSIPSVPLTAPAEIRGVLQALKENQEIISGQRGGRIEKLESTATTAEIIAKINEIIDRLQ